MEPDELVQSMIYAAAFLYEGGEAEALALLRATEPEFVAAHDYTTDTGWNGSEPDTFFLHGSRKLYETFTARLEPALQIQAAFEATHPNKVNVVARYRPILKSNHSWQIEFTKQLPQVDAIDAEFKEGE